MPVKFNRRPWAKAAAQAEAADCQPGRHPDGTVGIFRYGRFQMGELRGVWRDALGMWDFGPRGEVRDLRSELALQQQGWRLAKTEPPEAPHG